MKGRHSRGARSASFSGVKASFLGSFDGHAVPVCSQANGNAPDTVAAIVLHVVQEFFDKAQGGMTRLEGTHELFAVSVEWERQKVSIAPESLYVYSQKISYFCGRTSWSSRETQ